VQAAAAMRRRAPIYFFQFQSSSAAMMPELCGGGLVDASRGVPRLMGRLLARLEWENV
jgi:hypothetical protein